MIVVGVTEEDVNDSIPDRATNYTTQRPGRNQVNEVQVKTEPGKKRKNKKKYQ